MMRTLFIIPARGGSKGIPHKNVKLLQGKPLIAYTLEVARAVADDADICVSTDDEIIAETVRLYGLDVPFLRPRELATDMAGSYEVIRHAIEFYECQGKYYDVIVLLQPTSPFRKVEHVIEAMKMFEENRDLDMVVSVKSAASNPYYDCYEEDENGFLRISKGDGRIERRQDAPAVWEYNGAIYVMSVEVLKAKHLSTFTKIRPYVMEDIYSVDLDTMLDWQIAELLIKERLVGGYEREY